MEEEPEVYEREDLDTLFAACDAQQRLGFEFFLMTGMREQEVMHCSWEDINLARATVTVRYKPEYGFSPKNYKEREIPIPAKLVKQLKALKAKSDKTWAWSAHRRVPAEAQLPGRSQSLRRACEAQQGRVLAAQVPRDLRNLEPVGGSGSADCPAVAGPFGHGIDDAVFKAVTQPASTREGQRDFRLITRGF